MNLKSKENRAFKNKGTKPFKGKGARKGKVSNNKRRRQLSLII